MSKEQIEEVFKDLSNAPTGGVNEDFTIGTLKECHTDLFIRTVAGHLVSLNYRKQSEGEWITKHRHRGGFRTVTVVDSLGEKHTGIVDDRWECDDLYCSVCGKIAHDAFLNYCANCGAKMKGV